MPTMSSTTKETFDNLKLDVLTLHAVWFRVFRPLYAVDEHIDVLNKSAPNTFGVIQTTLLDYVCLALTRLGDPVQFHGKDRMCLEQLIDTLDHNTEQVLIDPLKNELESFKKKCEPFRDRRNLWIAHRDLKTVKKISAVQPSFSRAQVEEALKELRLFMDEVQAHFESAGTVYEETTMADDGETLINLLKKGVEAQDREITELINSLKIEMEEPVPIDITERYKLIVSEHQFASEIRLTILKNWLYAYAALAAAFSWTYVNQKSIDWVVTLLLALFTLFFWALDIRNRSGTRASHDIGSEIEKDPSANIPQSQRYFARLQTTTFRENLLTHSRAIDLFGFLLTVLSVFATLYLVSSKGLLPF